MKISESNLRKIVKEELLKEGDLVPMDFKSKAVRSTFKPGVADVFIFSGNAGQIARVLSMQRDSSMPGGGSVVYEQYNEDPDEPGTWIQEPAKVLEKPFIDFISKYSPFEKIIKHLEKAKKDEDEDEEHIKRIMTDAGFPDYLDNATMDSKYMSAWKTAMQTLPSMKRTLGHRDGDPDKYK
jgi:hypothetical protein